ncbi:molybdopterin molybdotransferase MoeA [Vogesella indigofera]|uniref:molybdopterin molybdotransferase MoeA n=1 Tax=Vogesella indigofera TaxID=45465 RepID=UPI00234F8FA1|nr:gephyrin-like molybdotransferase Glp [Vogesella indigofera]MDC7698383.1 molybdopterin molybdotransferase MoeA [Vogesella indigofera]
MQTVDQTRDWLLSRARVVDAIEQVPLLDAAGRVLARELVSPLDVPPHDNSAMDGYAVRAADAANVLPVSQRIPAGAVPQALAAASAARIFTGAVIPPQADAVVMQEQAEVQADGSVLFTAPVRIGQNIRRRGEDIAVGQLVLACGQRLRDADLGVAAAIGQPQLAVFRRLKVAVFFTGDELVEPGESAPAGKIYNSNRYWLVPALRQLGCEVIDLGIIADRLDATRAALRDAAARADVVMTCGGVSVGEEDHVKAAVEAEGELQLWKIAIKPGKPLASGRIGDADFIGLPGNPVSGYVTFAVLVRDFLRARMGETVQGWPQPRLLPAAFDWLKPDQKREEFLRVRIVTQDGQQQLQRFGNQGSGVLTSCAWADGLVRLQPGQSVQPGDLLPVYPL